MAVYGLKKKPTSDEVINAIVTEPNPIKCPDTTATRVRHVLNYHSSMARVCVEWKSNKRGK